MSEKSSKERIHELEREQQRLLSEMNQKQVEVAQVYDKQIQELARQADELDEHGSTLTYEGKWVKSVSRKY